MIEYITLFVIVVFMGVMIIMLSKSGFDTITSEQNRDFVCGPNECATNIQSGFKRCGVSGELVRYTQGEEVCNPVEACTSPATPYAVMSNGGTNSKGICDPGVPCSCTNMLKCPNYILSKFTSINGSAFAAVNGTRTIFPQTPGLPPIPINDGSIEFCKAPVEWIARSSPGCDFLNPQNPTLEEMQVCMGLPNTCNGTIGNPCISGTLAIVTPNPESIDPTTFYKYEVGCVEGKPCNCGEIAIYDTNFGEVICRTF